MTEAMIIAILQVIGIVGPIMWANRKARRKKEHKETKARIKDDAARKERQKVNDEHQRRTYRRTIEKIYDRIHANPEWIIRRDYYKGIEEDFEAYKELGGNGYVQTLMEEVREHYRKQN